MTRSRGNMAEPCTTVAGATPFTRTSGASSIGEFAHEMIGGGLGRVVGDASLFSATTALALVVSTRLPRKPCSFQVLAASSRDQVTAGDIDVERQRPFVVGNVAGRVARHKNPGGHANRIEPAVGERDLVQHFADARAIR